MTNLRLLKRTRKAWTCCDEFRDAEKREMIVATNKGWATVGDNDNVAFDVRFCPFCGTKLPRISKRRLERMGANDHAPIPAAIEVDLAVLPYEIADKLPLIGGKFGALASMCKSQVAEAIEKVIHDVQARPK